MRITDTIVRLGGDEFAFLMPETDHDAAKSVISRVQKRLLDEMEKKKWSVTFFIGVLTFIATPGSSDEAIKQADNLIYSVKYHGKNATKFANFTGT